MGFLEVVAGDYPAARSQFLRILQTKDQTQAATFTLSAIIGMATLQAHGGDAVTALGWVLAVLQHPALHWETQQRAETLRAELENQLTPTQIVAAQQQGVGQPFDAILATIIGQ